MVAGKVTNFVHPVVTAAGLVEFCLMTVQNSELWERDEETSAGNIKTKGTAVTKQRKSEIVFSKYCSKRHECVATNCVLKRTSVGAVRSADSNTVSGRATFACFLFNDLTFFSITPRKLTIFFCFLHTALHVSRSPKTKVFMLLCSIFIVFIAGENLDQREGKDAKGGRKMHMTSFVTWNLRLFY